MAPRYSHFLCAFLLILLRAVTALQDGVEAGGENGNPGMKFRLTQKGLNYFNEILAKQMTYVIPRLRVDDFQRSAGSAQLHFTNARIIQYKAPKSQKLLIKSPNGVQWQMHDMDVTVASHVKGTYGSLSDQGDMTMYARNVQLTVDIEPVKQANGQFGAVTKNCRASVDNMDFDLRNSKIMGGLMQKQKGSVINRMKPEISRKLCDKIRHFIDETTNEQLSKLPTKLPLNESAVKMVGDTYSAGITDEESRQSSKHGNEKDEFSRRRDEPNQPTASEEALRAIAGNLTKDLMLDYSNLEKPSVERDYIATRNKGEISYKGLGGTPFYPPDTKEPASPPFGRMLYVVASDYVANSMLYHAYKHNNLKHKISAEDSPDYRKYLRTSCDTEDVFETCVGTVIPEAGQTFPNSDTEVLLEALDAPAMFFRKDAKVDVLTPMKITLVAKKNGERKTMASADVNVRSKARMYFNGEKLKGNCTVEKFDLTVRENNLKNFDKSREKELGETTRTILEQVLNIYLEKGIKLPKVRGMELSYPKLNIFERTARLETDVYVDEEMVSKVVQKTLEKRGMKLNN